MDFIRKTSHKPLIKHHPEISLIDPQHPQPPVGLAYTSLHSVTNTLGTLLGVVVRASFGRWLGSMDRKQSRVFGPEGNYK